MAEQEIWQGQEPEADQPLVMTEAAISARRLVARHQRIAARGGPLITERFQQAEDQPKEPKE